MTKLLLPSTISSPLDISTLLLELREYARWFEHETVKRKMNVSQQTTPPVLAPVTSEYLRTLSNERQLTIERLETVIMDLEHHKDTAPHVTITLAAPVTPPIRKLLIDWFRTNLSPNVLISFQFNSTLLGGMVVRCGSRVFDWSFKRQLVSDQAKLTEALVRV